MHFWSSLHDDRQLISERCSCLKLFADAQLTLCGCVLAADLVQRQRVPERNLHGTVVTRFIFSFLEI